VSDVAPGRGRTPADRQVQVPAAPAPATQGELEALMSRASRNLEVLDSASAPAAAKPRGRVRLDPVPDFGPRRGRGLA
jgi:hypothetical protein